MLYLIILIISLILCFILTPVVRFLGVRYGVFDSPGPLAIHSEPIPRTGGLAILFSFLAAVSLGLIFSETSYFGSEPQLLGILAGGALIFIVGFVQKECRA